MSNLKKELNPSSLLDLKAELLRKQEELKKEKLQNSSKVKRTNVFKKTSVWAKKNAGVLERAQKDLEEKTEVEDVMEKSRKQLEAKTRLYESFARSKEIPDEDGSQLFLVDFQQKAIHTVSEKREEQRKQQEEEAKRIKDEEIEKSLLEEKLPEPENSEEAWVDYTDRFGRSRRCMRKDLPDIMKMNGNLLEKKNDDKSATPQTKDLMSADMQRELIRQKWEAMENESMTNPNGPLHYANVQHQEIRTHGTGYYQFSKQEENREEQLKTLRELREQTKDQRVKKDKLKDKRKAILKSRLAKVKRRKLVREGKNPDDIQSDISESDEEIEGLIGPSINEMDSKMEPEPELLVRDESLRNTDALREWDIGKKESKFFSEEAWLDERRKERINEFAPPQIYNDAPQSKKVSADYTKPKLCRTNQGNILKKITPENDKKFIKGPMALLEEQICENNSNTAKDPMALLEEQLACGNNESDTKSRDPMAMLEVEAKQNTTANDCYKTEADVVTVLRAIRSKVDAHDKCVSDGLDTIPLPSVGINSVSQNLYLEKCRTTLKQVNSNEVPDYFQTNSHTCDVKDNVNHVEYSYGDYNSINKQYYEYDQHYELHSDLTRGENTSEKLPSEISNFNNPQFSTIEIKQKPQKATQPQPVHFSAGPTKIDPRLATMPRYERVNLYEVPDELPVPPSAVNVPQYPSMEDSSTSYDTNSKNVGTNSKIVGKDSGNLVRNWNKQFNSKLTTADNNLDRVKHANIPFVSPYVQKTNEPDEKDLAGAMFDPTKPPPIS